jgi:hypothetical protein
MTLSAKNSWKTIFIHGYRPCQSRPRRFRNLRLQVMRVLEDIRNVRHVQKGDVAPFWTTVKDQLDSVNAAQDTDA